MSLQDAQAYILERVSDYCVQIEDIFKKDVPRYVTVIVRPPGKPEQEVVVTNDPDAQAMIDTIRRRFNIQPEASVCEAALREQEALTEAERLKRVAAEESVLGCAGKVAELRAALRDLKANTREIVAIEQDVRAVIDGWARTYGGGPCAEFQPVEDDGAAIVICRACRFPEPEHRIRQIADRLARLSNQEPPSRE